MVDLSPITHLITYHLSPEQQPGLILCITPAGSKSFQLNKWSKKHKKSLVVTYGKFPDMSIAEAREAAAKDIIKINQGIDLYEEKETAHKEDILSEVFRRWLKIHAMPHKKSWEEDKKRYALYMDKSLGKKRISWFTTERVRQWHSDITKLKKQKGGEEIISNKNVKEETITHYVTGSTANRALALLSTIFNTMLPSHPNPCKGVKKFKEKSRERFLQPEELKRFFEALDTHASHEYLRDYICISLFTGARRSNVLAMKWNSINFDQATWTIPAEESKNLESMIIPLTCVVLEILETRKINRSSIFVFPSSKSKTGHIVEPRKAWLALLKTANIKDARLHDLRRTLGSFQVMTGASTAVIGKTLGHKSSAATAVYARMNLDPVRESMEKATNAMLSTQNFPKKFKRLKRS